MDADTQLAFGLISSGLMTRVSSNCPWNRLRPVFLLGIISLTLAGCSNQFIYNRLDRLAQFYIERYVALDPAQDSSLKVNLEAIKEWHRHDELAAYLEFLDRVEAETHAEVTAGTVAAWIQQLREYYSRIQDKVMPALVEVAATLTPAQIDEFARNLDKRQQDLAKELLSRDEKEYREYVYKEIVKGIEEWLGKVTPEQQQVIHQTAQELERLDRAWLDTRRAWRQQVLAELQRQPGWQERMTDLVKNRTDYSRQEDVVVNDRNEQCIYAAVAAVLNMRTPRQSVKLKDNLQKWRRDLAALQSTGQKTL